MAWRGSGVRIPLAPRTGFPVISGNPFFIPKSKIQTRIPIPPPAGENRTQPSTSQSKNLHRVEESSRQQASQHPKTSSHWRKLDATRHPTVQTPPVTGTNDPLRHLPESVLFQRMEELPRSKTIAKGRLRRDLRHRLKRPRIIDYYDC